MEVTRSSTETLIEALRILARDIESQDGVANAAIAEAAERLDEFRRELLGILAGDLHSLRDIQETLQRLVR